MRVGIEPVPWCLVDMRNLWAAIVERSKSSRASCSIIVTRGMLWSLTSVQNYPLSLFRDMCHDANRWLASVAPVVSPRTSMRIKVGFSSIFCISRWCAQVSSPNMMCQRSFMWRVISFRFILIPGRLSRQQYALAWSYVIWRIYVMIDLKCTSLREPPLSGIPSSPSCIFGPDMYL